MRYLLFHILHEVPWHHTIEYFIAHQRSFKVETNYFHMVPLLVNDRAFTFRNRMILDLLRALSMYKWQPIT